MNKHAFSRRTRTARALAITTALALAVSVGIVSGATQAAPGDFVPRPDYTFRDANVDAGDRIEGILSLLTLEEKIALATSSPTPGAISRLGLSASSGGATEAVHGLNSGTATVFPVPLGFSQSWDKSLLNTIGNDIATEGTSSGSYSWWAPVMDLARDPRAGRNYELMGEDAYLVGQLGIQMATGMNARTAEDGYIQGIPLLKHAIGYNVEVNRLWLNSVLPERAKNEYYVKAFKYPIAAGAAKAFMNSYPLINGKPMSVNPVQRDALTEWTPDYSGTGHNEFATVNDYGSGSSMWVHSQRYFDDTPSGRALGLGESLANGQMSWSFRDYGSTNALIYDALARGVITEADIEATARRSLSLGLRFGTYDQTEIKNPYILNDSDETQAELVQDHRIDTLRASQEQIVLLKNEGSALPLSGSAVTETVLVGGLGEEIGHNNYTPRSP
ncbi:MAG: hypothetical protein LBT54_04860, partial [Bifidobacteriaceae bacterium]|nr:hypothetical protein [Bifidobacteriaceae bacterium]